MNSASEWFESINVYCEDVSKLKFIFHDTIKSPKITLHEIKTWPTFRNLFDIVNIKHRDKKVIIANADIYFDETLKKLDDISLKNKFLHITRKELPGNPARVNFFKQGIGAGDVWAFQAPINITNHLADARLGTHFCDHFISQSAKRAGYILYNPCLTVNCWHKHQFRNQAEEGKSYNKFMQSEGVYSWRELAVKYGAEIPFFVKFCNIYTVDKSLPFV